MPGGRAMKPGDVLTSASGKTVEVINTDAEGRLILGDGLWYAQKLGATHLVDVATLTGAASSRSARSTSAIFGQPEPGSTRARGRERRWRSLLADASLRRVRGAAAQRDRRHAEHRGPAGRRVHRGDVPERVRRWSAVGAYRHRRHRVVRRCEAVDDKGCDRRRGSRRSPSSRSRARRWK